MIRALAFASLLAAPAVAQLARVEGTIVDAQGKPVAARVAVAEVGRGTILVPNALEMLVVTPGESGAIRKRCSRELQADASGRFAIDELQPGSYGFVAADTEHGFAIRELIVDAKANAPLAIKLDPPRSLDVKVTGLKFDPTKHVLELKPVRALGNVNVVPRLKQDGWSFHAGPLPALDGWAVLGTEVVFDRDYRATLFQEFVSSPQTAEARIVLGAGDEISGQVRGPNGEPLSGVSVVAGWGPAFVIERGAITDAAGNYSVHLPELPSHEINGEVEARRWIVRDQAGCGNGPADVLARREFEIALGDGPTRVDLQVDKLNIALGIGALAPDFEATTLDGAKLKLSDLRGKVVLVDFWATWCAMCRAEMPAMEKFYAERAKDGRFQIVAISIDDQAELVRRFLESRKFPWPQIALGPPQSNPLTQLFNVWGTPATFVLDREGRIVARDLLGDPLRKAIDGELAKK